MASALESASFFPEFTIIGEWKAMRTEYGKLDLDDCRRVLGKRVTLIEAWDESMKPQRRQ